MKIKLFIFASVLYIVLLGAFIFNLDLNDYTLVLGSEHFSMPALVWILLPVLVFFIFALIHMSFYGFLRYLKYKNFFSDSDKFEKFICDLLLEKESHISFHTSEFRKASELSRSLKSLKKTNQSNKINEILELINELDEGKIVNLKKFKLSSDNALSLKNELNHIKNDLNYAYSKIKNKHEFENEADIKAFDEVLQKGSFEQIKSIKLGKNAQHILSLIKRFANGSLELNTTEFEELINAGNLDEKDYLDIAKISTKCLNPDSLIAIFKKLKNTRNEAHKAYLFILAEFSMFDELRLELGNNEKDFNDFKIVLIAREKNKNIDLHRFIQ